VLELIGEFCCKEMFYVPFRAGISLNCCFEQEGSKTVLGVDRLPEVSALKEFTNP